MPCYHPKIRIENLSLWETAADGHKYHPATITKPDNVYEKLEELKNTHPNYKKQIIPCRTCIGCRLDYSRDWANRGYLEAKKGEHNYFITLTYDDEHKPFSDTMISENGITYTDLEKNWNGYLEKRHFESFLHDIRQKFKRKYNHTGIKFLGCGEYGGKTNRPHYHIILFNAPFPSETFYNSKFINQNIYWQNSLIEEVWRYGISNITLATWDTIAYTARYVTKKIYGTHSKEEYASKGQTPEFIRMSRGIGKDYYEQNKERIWKNDEIIIKNTNGAISTKPPKYYTRLLEKENKEASDNLKKNRQKLADQNQKVLDQTFTGGRLERLRIKESTHEEKHKQLKRHMENGTTKRTGLK